MTSVMETARAIQETTPSGPNEFGVWCEAGRPFVMRGLVADWPLCAAASHSPERFRDYLLGFYNGTPVHVMTGPRAIQGRLFYTPDYRKLNFEVREGHFGHLFNAIMANSSLQAPLTLYMGSAAQSKHWPGLAHDNPMLLLNAAITPKLWIGGPAVVGPHNDYLDNVACVVTGKRRFRLFPPNRSQTFISDPWSSTPQAVR